MDTPFSLQETSYRIRQTLCPRTLLPETTGRFDYANLSSPSVVCMDC